MSSLLGAADQDNPLPRRDCEGKMATFSKGIKIPLS